MQHSHIIQELDSLLQRCTKVIGIGKSYDYNWPNLMPYDALPEPMVFVKPTTSLTTNGRNIEIPKGCVAYHEVEIAVVIGTAGRNIPEADAMRHVAGYALALDMTAKNVQADAIKRGYPWCIAKGLDTFTPIGRLIPKEQVPDPRKVTLELQINGEIRQRGTTSSLLYSIPQLVAFCSGIFTLCPGDVILTGSPPNVAAFYPGETLHATMTNPAGEKLDQLTMGVVERQGGYMFDSSWLETI